MDALVLLGRWTAQQGASWLLRNRWRIGALVGLLVVGAVLVGAGIGATVSGGGADQQARSACRTMGFDVASGPGGAEAGYVPGPVGAPPVPEGGLVDGFGPGETEQIAVAQAIVAAGTAAGVGTRGMVVAIATALQESGLRALDFGDRDSLGPFQQRPSQGWGSPEEVRDPAFSARAFFGGPTSPHYVAATGQASPGGLIEVSGWDALPITVAAQRVQRSAFPTAYAKHEARATRIVAALTGGTPIPTSAPATPAVGAPGVPAAATPGVPAAPVPGTPGTTATPGTTPAGTPAAAGGVGIGGGGGGATVTTAEDFRASGFDIDAFCAANVAAPGSVAVGVGVGYPSIPAGAWTAPLSSRITSEFGMRLHPVHRVWKLHQGTDFTATVGTPLRAASDGVVSTVSWYGGAGLTVVVDHAGGVRTRFLHLSQVLVTPGQTVTGGEVIALSGNTGTGTAPHFHLETHVGGVPVDPVTFLAERGVDLRAASS